MSINQPNFETVPKIEKTNRQMMAQLSNIFHPDKTAQGGGDEELFKEMMEYYRSATNGRPEKLIKMYQEWVGAKPEGEKQKKILKLLEQESNALYELKKKKPSIFRPTGTIKAKYIDLCREYGVQPDNLQFCDFLYNQGWITEEEKGKKIDFYI